MNVGMGPDAGEQRFVPAFQKLGQKSFPVAEVIDKAPCIGAGPQGQAASGKGAQPDSPTIMAPVLSRCSLVDFRLGMKVKLEPPCVPLSACKARTRYVCCCKKRNRAHPLPGPAAGVLNESGGCFQFLPPGGNPAGEEFGRGRNDKQVQDGGCHQPAELDDGQGPSSSPPGWSMARSAGAAPAR